MKTRPMKRIDDKPIWELKNATFFALLQQELESSGSVRFRVKGISMQPMLRNNRDEVLLFPLSGHELVPGDICLFRFRDTYILHRFLYQKADLLYFRGDNVLTRYEFCRYEDVIGVVSKVYRDGAELLPLSLKWKLRIRLHRFSRYLFLKLSSFVPRSIKNMIKRYLYNIKFKK